MTPRDRAAKRAAATLAVAALLVTGCAAHRPGGSGSAGRPTDDGAAVLVNGRAAPTAGPLTLSSGDRVEVHTGDARIRTGEGLPIRLYVGSAVEHQGAQRGVEYYLVATGSAEADLGPGTSVGAAAAWAVAAAPSGARVRVTVVTGAATSGCELRAVRGEVLLHHHAFSVRLVEGAEVRLAPGIDGPGSLGIYSRAADLAPVRISREAAGLTHEVTLPAGAACSVADRGASTRVACLRAPPGVAVGLSTLKDGLELRSGRLGASTSALLEEGGMRLELPALGQGGLARLLEQSAEFAAGTGSDPSR